MPVALLSFALSFWRGRDNERATILLLAYLAGLLLIAIAQIAADEVSVEAEAGSAQVIVADQ